MDSTRIYARTRGEVRADHLNRYEFAARRLGGSILDAACGCGYGSKTLQEKGNHVTGADIEEEAILWARCYFSGPDYVICDIQKRLPAGEFDAVVSFETLEHLDKPNLALQNFRMVAGKLIASVPNELVFKFKLYDPRDDKYPHKRHYTPDGFEQMLTDTGWKVDEKFCQVGKRNEDAMVVTGVDGRSLIYVCS